MLVVCFLSLFLGCATERQSLLITVTPNHTTVVGKQKDGSTPVTVKLMYRLDF